MTFEQQLVITILDKGLLAILLALIAGLVNWWLQRDKAQMDLIKEIASLRAKAYANFWRKTDPFREIDPPPFTDETRKTAHDELNKAYFDEDGAMYISYQAASRLLRARRRLKDGAKESVARKAFSLFRTQLKRDLLIYTKREANTPLLSD